jgi:hypothetical protein
MQKAVGILLLALCFGQLFLASYCLADLVFLLPPSITPNVPVDYMLNDIMILIKINPFQGPFEGIDSKNPDFFGP